MAATISLYDTRVDFLIYGLVTPISVPDICPICRDLISSPKCCEAIQDAPISSRTRAVTKRLLSESSSIEVATRTASTNELKPCDRLTTIYHCQHTYHTTCLYTWLDKASTCPMCRAQLFPAKEWSVVGRYAVPVSEEVVSTATPQVHPNPGFEYLTTSEFDRRMMACTVDEFERYQRFEWVELMV
jgi:hypothetical protein